tara:strand:- start:344 stop:499 length:156 start_codon:yes stop_codon:yes gene_type:complete
MIGFVAFHRVSFLIPTNKNGVTDFSYTILNVFPLVRFFDLRLNDEFDQKSY